MIHEHVSHRQTGSFGCSVNFHSSRKSILALEEDRTHFSLAWLSLGAPALLLLYIVEGSFSAVIPGRDTRDTKPTKPPPVALPASEAG